MKPNQDLSRCRRMVWSIVSKTGVVHHWPRTYHSRWQPPHTSIQGSLWRSSGISIRTSFICPVHIGCARLVEALGLGAHLYADDTQLYGHCSPANSYELASRVLRAIDSIHEWMSSNRLSLNTGKTQFSWLGTKHSLAKRETDRLHSLLPSLTELTSVRNLGFIIDQELNMKDHITKLCQSCYYQLRQIRTVRHSLTSSAIQTLVHAFICTRVDFSNSLLYGTSAYLLDRLQSVLNSAARLILRIGKYDPISAAIRRDLHWLPVPFRIQYKLNSITSNCLAGRAPEYLIELCHSVTDIPARRNLRSSSRVHLLVPSISKGTV